MTEAQMLTRQAPKTGPWIIGYVVWLSAGFITGSQTTLLENSIPARLIFWIGLFACVGMIVWTSWRRHKLLGTISPAARLFWRRIILWTAVMFGGFCGIAAAQFLLAELPRYWQIMVLIPSVGIAGMIITIFRYVADETDEYLRTQAVQQILIASALTLVIAALWGGAALALDAWSGDASIVTLLWFGAMGIGRMVNEAKY